jgi:hypothetical protein
VVTRDESDSSTRRLWALTTACIAQNQRMPALKESAAAMSPTSTGITRLTFAFICTTSMTPVDRPGRPGGLPLAALRVQKAPGLASPSTGSALAFRSSNGLRCSHDHMSGIAARSYLVGTRASPTHVRCEQAPKGRAATLHERRGQEPT